MPQTTRRALPVDDRRPTAPDRELTHPLDRLKRMIRVFVFLDVVLFVGLFLSLWFWLGVGADYGLFKGFGVDVAQQLTPVIRIGTTVVLALGLVALVVWRVTVLVNKRFTLTSLALVLEKRHPKLLGDRLITAIQMFDVEKARRAGYSVEMVQHTIKEARERMRQVNVAAVFNWGRLRLKLGLILLVWANALSAGLVLYAVGVGLDQYDTARGFKKTADVCGIFTERNLLFQPTPWPRRAHIEVIDFDDDGHPNELRVGKGAPTPPKITARAVKWVVEDDPRKNPDGWRAMTVGDLKAFGVATPPGVEGDGQRVDDLERAGTLPEGDPTFAKLDAAAADLNNTRKLRKLDVPGVLKMRIDGTQSKSRNFLELIPDATGKFATEVANLTETVRFTVSAEDFVTARRQITLVLPPTLVDLYRDEFQPAYLHHAGPILSDQEQLLYAGGRDQVFALRGRLYRLPPKKISISSDKSVFSAPAGTEVYLTAEADKDLKLIEVRAVGPNPMTVPEFHKAEAKEETRDDRGAIVADRFVDLPIARPAGAAESRLELDRDSATGLRVNEASFGGKKLGVRRFTLKLDGKRAVRQLDKPTEFQIDMTDTDNVKSTRTIAITAVDDAPPQVEVLVDPVIRRVGGAYLITPIARVPFLPDSKITDDVGLSAVRFEFKKTAEESPSVVALRAIAAASVTANSLAPTASWAMPATVLHSQTQFELLFGATIPQTDASANVRLPGVDVDRFAADMKTLQRYTLEQLGDVTVPRDGSDLAERLLADELNRQKVNAADMPPADLARVRAELLAKFKEKAFEARLDRGPQSVKSIKLSDMKGDAFDLQRFMPELLEKQLDAVQQRYKIELFITAKDVNVELTGKDGKPADPRTARNLDPIRLMVVSEQDLLVEIGKDEEMQSQRMDDAMVKATGGKSKMDREFSLIRTLPALAGKEKNDQIQSTQVRVTDIGQDLGKVRELLTAMKTEYEKLYREMDVNRFAAPNMYKYKNERGTAEELQTGYLDLIALILDENRALSKAEKSVEEVRATLAAGQTPAEPALTKANADYLALIRLLQRLSDQIGTGIGITEQRRILKKIIDDQLLLRGEFGKVKDDLINALRRPAIVLPKQVPTVKANGTTKVKLGVRWNLYPETSLFISVDPPATSELKTPKELIVKAKGEEAMTEVEVEITAGSKTGVHTITLLPGTFRKVELQIEVTK